MPKLRKRKEKKMKNQNFLRKILELKNELFGQFSTTITKESRKTAWIHVNDYAVSTGLIGSDKEFCYVRDATWPKTKIDQLNKTGAQGGPQSKLDDTDKLVIEIIGKELAYPIQWKLLPKLKTLPRTLVILSPTKTMIMSPQKASARFNKVHVEVRKELSFSNQMMLRTFELLK
ncbi:unnamed protein product [Psylliodes chrysocephalus]|uniref:Uncharacterized protein n=1 Tax=Psylliodes chrysocephalus TaxID=3402493 RepID=A0A9P0GJI0_9CUCU|nr:unnamed protein product [Psylliodes chrysocephala]